MGRASWTIAIGEQMREAAEALEKKTGVPFRLFDRLTGLAPSDAFVAFLANISGKPVPDKFRRQRSQLLDAMLDGHFSFGGKKIAIGAEPDLLFACRSWLAEMGAPSRRRSRPRSRRSLEKVPADEVLIGDLEDLENRAGGCDLIVTHSHGRQMSGAARHPAVPLWAADLRPAGRCAPAARSAIAARAISIFEIGNMFMAQVHEPTPADWRLPRGDSHDGAAVTAH